MPANRFAPDRITVGHGQDARIVDRILQSILGRWPIEKCDIQSVYHAAVDYSDGSQVPIENINVDELFNSATGIAAALGCMDFLNGLNVDYVDGVSLSVGAGHILHRGDFKRVECVDGTGCTTIPAVDIVSDCCAPLEGNPSGLDSDMWYYVYVNMNAAGPTPPLSELIRISSEAPIYCEGKGFESPTYNYYRFIGSFRTMDTGVIRPYTRFNNGWVYWLTAAAASDYQALGYGTSGTPVGNAGSWVRYRAAQTGSTYGDGDKHIPPSADFCRVVLNDDASSPSNRIFVRPMGDAGEGFNVWGNQVTAIPFSGFPPTTYNTQNALGEVIIPVNMCGLEAADIQTFEWQNDGGEEELDVSGYHERLQ